MAECACGCGRPAKRKWFVANCRWNTVNRARTPEMRRKQVERARENRPIDGIPMHSVVATVRRMDDDDNIQVARKLVRVPTPTVGLWGI